ncbi:MauE/DoxX family redox-associated membrane protein [Actinomadura sp. 9N407]|uniref:MauE/DoxX family redox-associated membrane protein n=1 Tax=Actinomadura sp. 9N407 TaxID=3375154 RepID=UPI003794857D
MEHYYLIAARCLLATVFAVAFLGKARSARRRQAFRTTVRNLISRRAAGPLAGLILCCEAAIAVLLVPPVTARAGFALAAGLLSVFIAGVFRAIRNGIFAECGCFGDHSAVLGYPIIVRNGLLLAVAVPGLVLAPGAVAVAPALAAAIAGVLVAIVYVRYLDIAMARVLAWLKPRLVPESREPG